MFVTILHQRWIPRFWNWICSVQKKHGMVEFYQNNQRYFHFCFKWEHGCTQFLSKKRIQSKSPNSRWFHHCNEELSLKKKPKMLFFFDENWKSFFIISFHKKQNYFKQNFVVTCLIFVQNSFFCNQMNFQKTVLKKQAILRPGDSLVSSGNNDEIYIVTLWCKLQFDE